MKLKLIAFLLSLILPLDSLMAAHSVFELLEHIRNHHAAEHEGTFQKSTAPHSHDAVHLRFALVSESDVTEDEKGAGSGSWPHHSHVLCHNTTFINITPKTFDIKEPLSESSFLDDVPYEDPRVSSPYLASIFRPPRA